MRLLVYLYSQPWLRADGAWRPTRASWALVAAVFLIAPVGAFLLLQRDASHAGRVVADAIAIGGIALILLLADVWDRRHPPLPAPVRRTALSTAFAAYGVSLFIDLRLILCGLCGFLAALGIIGLRNNLHPEEATQNLQQRRPG